MAQNHIDQRAGNEVTQIGIVKGSVTIINYPSAPIPVEVKNDTFLADGPIPENPYRGLFAFRPENASLFFGRESFTERLVRAVDHRSLVVVLGASGSGKSSVVFAGLIPALQASGQWLFATFRPSNDPFQGLTQALVPFLYQDPVEQITAARKLSASLREGEIPLSDIVGKIQQAQPDRRLLIIADQFEELYWCLTCLF